MMRRPILLLPLSLQITGGLTSSTFNFEARYVGIVLTTLPILLDEFVG